MYGDARKKNMSFRKIALQCTISFEKKELIMDTSINKHKTHPMMVIAAVAVVLFCAVGSAAILGWLPSSKATGSVPAEVSGMPAAGAAGAAAAAGQAQGLAPNAAPSLAQQGQSAEPAARSAPCSNCGVIESVRSVEHRGKGSGVGAVGGAVLGGLLGNQIGSGHGRQLATLAGAVGGGVAGNQIEGNMKSYRTWNIVVRMDNGSTRTFHQSSEPAWRNGDPVRIVNGQLRSMD